MYSTFGSGKPKNGKMHNVYSLELETEQNKSERLQAVEVPVICSPVSCELLESFGNIDLADSYGDGSEVTVDVLVGMDSYWRFVKQGRVRVDSGLVVVETVFGWVVSDSCVGSSLLSVSLGTPVSHQLLNLSSVPGDTLRNFWDLESIGISPKDQVIDHPVLVKFEENIRFSEGRYEVALPWKSSFSNEQLLNNEKLAIQRLKSLTRRFSREPELESRYNEALREIELCGIVQEVKPEELVVSHPVFYLPHHQVVKELRTSTKVRPVFDVSASGYNGVSLNDCLESGPSLINNLVEILVRFCRWLYALTVDITKAFLQIKVCRRDQDVHRFLWNDGGTIRTMQFLRVQFGNKSSPFLLNTTIKHHLNTFQETPVILELKKNLYVDDWLSGADSEKEACDMFFEAKEIMAKASMPLAKWTSNSQVVSDKIY